MLSDLQTSSPSGSDLANKFQLRLEELITISMKMSNKGMSNFKKMFHVPGIQLKEGEWTREGFRYFFELSSLQFQRN